jgi:hypothetical protein
MLITANVLNILAKRGQLYFMNVEKQIIEHQEKLIKSPG